MIKVAVFFGWLGLLFLGENLLPAHRHDRSVRRWGRNGFLGVLSSAMGPLCVVPLSLLAADLAPDWRAGVWASGWAIILDVLVLDLFLYWWHRVNHEWPILWRLHEVHHLDEHLDTTSGVRFHFGEVALGAVARAPVIFLFDISFASVLIFETLVVAGVIFHHSNIRLSPVVEAILARVIITPGIHRVHHHAQQADTDSNYGTIFSFWDHLFGSASETRAFEGMTFGVQGRRQDQSLPRLLIRPFVRRRGKEQAR
ncbi:MAG: sterol desaturase family protein [Pseudomonadota bacterium]